VSAITVQSAAGTREIDSSICETTPAVDAVAGPAPAEADLSQHLQTPVQKFPV
jgi:hypothetical protein